MPDKVTDTFRVVQHISRLPDSAVFNSHVIYHDLKGMVSEDIIDTVIKAQLWSGNIIKSSPTGAWYKKNMAKLTEKVVEMEKNIHKRVEDLEVKYKWLEEIVAKMHYEKPEKKRLWSANDPIPPEVKYIDVMYNDGRIVENFYIGNMPLVGANVLAWREAKTS